MTDAIKKFEAQVRKTQRMIDALATLDVCDVTSAATEAEPILRAVNRCDDLANKLAFEPGADARSATVRELRIARVTAREELQGRIASHRSVRLAALTIEIALRANSRPY